MAIEAFREDVVTGKTLLLNVEYKVNNIPVATLMDSTTNEDIGKGLITYGYLLVEKTRDKRLKQLVNFYFSNTAKLRNIITLIDSLAKKIPMLNYST